MQETKKYDGAFKGVRLGDSQDESPKVPASAIQQFEENKSLVNKMPERVTGFYWCDLGKCRGLLSGWCVCYWDATQKQWNIPYYNDKGNDNMFDSVDETPIIRDGESFIGMVPYLDAVKNGQLLSEFQHRVFNKMFPGIKEYNSMSGPISNIEKTDWHKLFSKD